MVVRQDILPARRVPVGRCARGVYTRHASDRCGRKPAHVGCACYFSATHALRHAAVLCGWSSTVDIGLLATYPAPETTPWHALAGASNASNDAAPLRVTLVTLCTAALDHLCAASIDNKRAYAQRHGYKLFVAPDDLIDPSRPVAWSKLRALQAALADGAHLVAWFDADALVMAPHIRLEDIAQQAGPHAAHILAADHRGPNTGVWLLRACPWSAALLQHMWDAGDTYAALRPAQCVFRYEQRALHFLLQSALWRSTMVDGRHGQRHVYMAANGVRERTALVHTCVLNSLPSWYRPGNFVVHLAGVKGAARCLLFRRAYSVASAAAGRVPGADGVPAGPTWWQCIAASTRWQLT